MLRLLTAFLVLSLQAFPVAAAAFSVRVVDAKGRPVSDAVVTLRPIGQTTHAPLPLGNYSVSQKNLQFHPFVLIVPVGANVSFPNRDATKHHVYSFSAAKRFELKLFARDQSRSVRFDKPGVVALGCNIHDAMTAFIVVTDSPWTAQTDPRGIARFANAPNAAARLIVWHPYLRAPGNSLNKLIAPGTRSESFVLNLRAPPMLVNSDY